MNWFMKTTSSLFGENGETAEIRNLRQGFNFVSKIERSQSPSMPPTSMPTYPGWEDDAIEIDDVVGAVGCAIVAIVAILCAALIANAQTTVQDHGARPFERSPLLKEFTGIVESSDNDNPRAEAVVLATKYSTIPNETDGV